MSSIIQQIKDKNEELKKLVAEAALGTGLKDFFLEAFKKLPANFEAVRWAQYTPHFNDGEACEFSVHETYFKLTDADDNAGDNWQSAWGLRYDKQITDEIEEILGQLHTDMQEIEDVLKTAFGDGYQITITSAGEIEVEEYSHD